MHRLAKLSLANRSVVALITVIVAIFGFVSLGSLKQELIPSIETPQAAIVTTYIGASPEVIDKQVSQPIENAVRALDGLVSSTTTSQSNISILRVEFEYGTATSKVTEKLNAALASVTLPSEASAKVLSGSFDSVPIIALGVSSNTGDNEALGKTLEDVAKPLFSSISGVRDVTVAGVIEKRINLTFNQAKLTANGLSQQSVTSALQANGFIIPAGTIEDKQGTVSVEVGTAVNSLEALKNLPLIGTKTSVTSAKPSVPSFPGMPSGITIPSVPSMPSVSTTSTAVRLGDVAKVVYENSPVTSISRINGKASLAISITKTQDANTVAVSHGVEKKIDELKQKLGNVTVITIFDQAPFVEKSLENLSTEGLLGLGLNKSAVTLGGVSTGVDAKISTSYGVFVKPKVMVSNEVELFARLGYANSKLKLSTSGASESETSGSFAYGLGGNYYLNKQTYLTATYMSLYSKEGMKATGLSFGVGYKF